MGGRPVHEVEPDGAREGDAAPAEMVGPGLQRARTEE